MHNEILAVSRDLIGIADRLDEQNHFALRAQILKSALTLKQIIQNNECALLSPFVMSFMSKYAKQEEISLDHAVNEALIRWALTDERI